MEHALGDFLHGKLLLKHVVDWVVLRRQAVDWEAFWAKCKAFRFDRFVALTEALADVVEGKREYETLPTAYKEVFDEMLREQEGGSRTTQLVPASCKPLLRDYKERQEVPPLWLYFYAHVPFPLCVGALL